MSAARANPHYRSENRLLRWMLVRFQRPPWAEMIVVVTDAAFASKANIQLICQRGYLFAMAFARTWCVDNGQALQGKKCRNDGSRATKILGTTLPDVTARQVVDVYRRRWTVERLIKELKGATGLGQHQVTKDPQWVERSVAMSVMAYLVIVKLRAQDIPEQSSWNLFMLNQNSTWQLAQGQLERATEQRLRKALQEREAA